MKKRIDLKRLILAVCLGAAILLLGYYYGGRLAMSPIPGL